MISRVSLVKSAPRFASLAPFCRLICDHLLWPDIGPPSWMPRLGATDGHRGWAVRMSGSSWIVPIPGPVPAEVGYLPARVPSSPIPRRAGSRMDLPTGLRRAVGLAGPDADLLKRGAR